MNVSFWTPWILWYYLMFLFQWAFALISLKLPTVLPPAASSSNYSYYFECVEPICASGVRRGLGQNLYTDLGTSLLRHFPFWNVPYTFQWFLSLVAPATLVVKLQKPGNHLVLVVPSSFYSPSFVFLFLSTLQSLQIVCECFFYILIRIYSYLQAIQLGAYSPTPEVETPILILWNKTFFCCLPETHCAFVTATICKLESTPLHIPCFQAHCTLLVDYFY